MYLNFTSLSFITHAVSEAVSLRKKSVIFPSEFFEAASKWLTKPMSRIFQEIKAEVRGPCFLQQEMKLFSRTMHLLPCVMDIHGAMKHANHFCAEVKS